MLPASPCPSVRTPVALAELDALRAELRCILQHPAITPARRAGAEYFIGRCQQAPQLQQWLTLVVAECARWEEQTLAAESASGRNSKTSPIAR